MSNYEIKETLIVLNDLLLNTNCLRLRSKIFFKIEKLVELLAI